MSLVGRSRMWLRAAFLRGHMERDMREEMDAHLAAAVERFRARGMSEGDARAAAQREFGHLASTEELARDARGGQWADTLAADLKYALRVFARAPLTTLMTVLTLALGIGFSSAVFSALTGVLTRPAPGVPDDHALVKLRGTQGNRPDPRLLSYPELLQYAALTTRFESTVGWVTSPVVVDVGNEQVDALGATAQFVTANYFRTLGIRLAAGHPFAQSRFDELAPAELTAIVSDGLATERFGGARGAIGRRVNVNGVEVTIIGVAPPRFAGVVQSSRTRMLWMPLSAWQPVTKASRQAFTDPDAALFDAAARLEPNVTVGDALAAVRVVAARVDAAARARMPQRPAGSADVVPLRGVMELGRYESEMRPAQLVFPMIALLILLVCTTTVSSLLVGSAINRRHEIGVRLAMGASRRRVVRQLLTEVLVLAVAGAALGLWVFGALLRLVEVSNDGFDVSPDWTTTVFTLLYAMATATMAGLSPALHATRAGLSEVLKDTGGATKRSRLQGTFVVAQIAIAQPLMVMLTATTLHIAGRIPYAESGGLRDRLLFVELDTYVAARLAAPDTVPALVRRLAEMPGVEAVLPVGYGQGVVVLESAQRPTARDSSALRYRNLASSYDVPADYFRIVGAAIVRGREFVPSDTALGVSPVIINEKLATSLFGSRDPIGRHVFSAPTGRSTSDERPTELEIIGVVRLEADNNSLGYPSDYPPMYVPFRRQREGRLLIRTTGPAASLIPAVMELVRHDARMLPVTRIATLAQGDRERRESRLQAVGTVAGAGVIALLLAATGLYAMVGLAVGQRRREIGVRVALGAKTRQIVTMFFGGGLRVALVGLALGLPLGAAGLTLFVGFEINVPLVVGVVALAVVSVASLASWVPALRAAGVDPMNVLRPE